MDAELGRSPCYGGGGVISWFPRSEDWWFGPDLFVTVGREGGAGST